MISADEFEASKDLDNTPDIYRDTRDSEGIPVHFGLYVEDLYELETGYWERTGERGAFVNLYGSEGINDIQIHELTPGGETTTQHHLYDEIVYVAEGNGVTVIDSGDQDRFTFEWSEHSLFYLPKNVPYKHINVSDKTARLISETPLPLLLEMYQDTDFLLNPPESITETRDQGYYSSDAEIVQRDTGAISWVANFIADTKKFDELADYQHRGAGGATVFFPFPEASMRAHISEFPPGRYKKAHRHHPGANIVLLSGKGYSLMWRDDHDDKIKIDWKPGSLFTPPALWYHQHFNPGTEPARYLPLHAPKLAGMTKRGSIMDPENSQNQIEYTDEDPKIQEIFKEELGKRGGEFKMPEECYIDPQYEFTDKIAASDGGT